MRAMPLIGQTFPSRFGWRFCGVLVLAALIYASLLLPPQLEQLRTGHWGVEHFLAYLVAVPIVCLGWPRHSSWPCPSYHSLRCWKPCRV